MKKITLLFLVAFITMSSVSFAKIWVIKVSNFQFSPSTLNAKVGDTIRWKWVNGSHTTTSLTIPVGATAWNKPIDASHIKFQYKVTKVGTYNFKCTPHFAAGMKGTIKVTAALIANLDDFIVSSNDANALLNWKTSSSTDVSYFSIQKSTDGNNFTEVSKVNANASNLYSFKDNVAPVGKYIYYQVEMVDVNGNRQLSPIAMFTNNHAATSKLITSLSPNPVSMPGHLMLQFNADNDGFMLARLFNQSGLLIKEEKLSAVKGLNSGHFHIGNVSPGTYYITFTLGGITEKHVVIVR